MSRRLVVLVLIKGLGIGGAEKLIASSAPLWDRRAYDYHVAYVLPWKDQLVPELEEAGVPVHLLGQNMGQRRMGVSPSVVRRLRQLVRHLGADLVHAHLPSMGVLARLVSPVPVVYTEHNLADSYRWPTRLLNFLTYRRNTVALAVSEAVAESVRRYPGPSPMVIPNGVAVSVPPEGAGAARAELGLGPEEPLVVHVGNIRPLKGHQTLVAAAGLLAELYPQATIVSIGGEKHPGDLAALHQEVARAGLGGRLRFLGRRYDALSFVAAADVFVNPAQVEGLPVAVLEAMALERPVVATRVGGVPSVVRDGETGLLCDPDDPAALAVGMARLLEDGELAKRLGAAGRALVEGRHGLEAMVRTVEGHYHRVLAAR
ncbi:MAG: glycosyltransferase [Actinomycetota bacterium]|nr:glycosyltransferase [Actinomycetota bacterium]